MAFSASRTASALDRVFPNFTRLPTGSRACSHKRASNVGFRGNSGRGLGIAECPLMTPTGHPGAHIPNLLLNRSDMGTDRCRTDRHDGRGRGLAGLITRHRTAGAPCPWCLQFLRDRKATAIRKGKVASIIATLMAIVDTTVALVICKLPRRPNFLRFAGRA
jgi:hypothetical protein